MKRNPAKFICVLLIFLYPFRGHGAQGLHRLNFFPDVSAYIQLGYEYQIVHIEVPRSAQNDKEVVNFSNMFSATYGHRINPRLFLGLSATYEEASENAAEYGIVAPERFATRGFNEPEAFLLWRIREQERDRGLIDFFLAYSDSLGGREVGSSGGNRLRGRNRLVLGLSHGLLESEWEFRSRLDYHYLGPGEEQNAITQKTYELKKSFEVGYRFAVQKHLAREFFAMGSIGFSYRSAQDIHDDGGEFREIQSGTGSIFELAFKKNVSSVATLVLGYQLQRNEYFVKGTTSNLDGDRRVQSISLDFIHGF